MHKTYEFKGSDRFLLFCAGVDLQTLQGATSGEINDYKIMGGGVLIPSVLAFFSGSYAISLVFGNIPLGIVFGIVWSCVIFWIDRSIVALTRKPNWGALFRILLATVLSFTIAEPLLLRIFDDGIQEHRKSIILQYQQERTQELKSKIQQIEQESKQELQQITDAETAYIEEVDGTGGSKRPYRGPIAKEKESVYNRKLNNYEIHKQERDAQIKALNAEIQRKEQEVQSSVADGLLGRMKTLHDLSETNDLVCWGAWFIRLALLLIELIPIALKFGNGKSNKSLYYELRDLKDSHCIEVHEMLSEETRDIVKLEESVHLEERRIRAIKKKITLYSNYMVSYLRDVTQTLLQLTQEREKQLLEVSSKIEDEQVRKEQMNSLVEIYSKVMTYINELFNNYRISK